GRLELLDVVRERMRVVAHPNRCAELHRRSPLLRGTKVVSRPCRSRSSSTGPCRSPVGPPRSTDRGRAGMAPIVRYDPVADWYLDVTRDWGSESLGLLPDDVRGRRLLDLACGYGKLSRHLAGLGASVTAVDLSARLLARAEETEAAEPLGIRYTNG